MLTKRQIQILEELEQHTTDFIKGNRLAACVGCSLKTLQNDMKEVKQQIEMHGGEILSITSKGYQFLLHDASAYQAWKMLLDTRSQKEPDFNDPAFRVSYILMKLLAHDAYIKSEELADEMYISRSRISIDLKEVKEVLTQYDLAIEQKPNYGIRICGLEKNKRLCIVKEQLPLNEWREFHTSGEQKNKMIAFISDVIVETLMNAHYKISDIVFQNLVLHVYVAVNRMMEADYLERDQAMEALPPNAHEILIAKRILKKLQEQWSFELNDCEIQYLAMNLLGKRSYDNDEIITTQMDTMVNDILEVIREKLGIDLTGDIELRISLALHMIPLISRVKFNMQLKNSMIDEIKQYFTLAYDMATIAASYLTQAQQIHLQEDEIAYLAVHFNLALQKKMNKVNPKKVLIICNSRRGDSLMIQHTLLKWFDEMISQLDIVNAIEVPLYDLDSYDCIFATFLHHENIPKRAIRINFFLNQQDKNRIERALKGESEAQEVLRYFDPSLCIFDQKEEDKDALIQRLCKRANEVNSFDEDLYQAVMRREELGYTAFGNGIAVPHPDSLISLKTTVITAILKKPIAWGPQKVQLVFLICVEKGNQKDLRSLFECISLLMANPDVISDIIEQQDFEALKQALTKLMK